MFDSETNSSNVFNLISIKSDRQDTSFVEKVIPLQEPVISFCNAILPNSARVVDSQQIALDFKLLNGCSLPVLGLYGDKEAMLDVFSRKRIVDDATLLQMKGGRLKPGLYASLDSNEVVYVFYWHEGAQFEEATKKSLSCNFVRYVIDLCDTVYVCLEDKDFKECLPLYSPRSSSNTNRTTSLHVRPSKVSMDDFLVSPGFRIKILDRVLETNRLSAANRSFLKNRYLLADGLFRIALLAATDHERKPGLLSQKRYIKCKELSKVLAEWSSFYDLDVTSLSNEDLLLLSQFTLPKAYEEHSRLKSSIDMRSKEHQSKLHEIPSKLKKTQKTIFQELELALVKYINQCYLGCPLCATPSFFDKRPTQSTGKLSPSSPFSGQSDNNAVQVTKRCMCDGFSRLEEVLCKTWEGDADDQKNLIFEGSEIEFVGDGTGQPFRFGMQASTFVVESASRKCDDKGPLLMGGTVMLRPKHGIHAMPQSISLFISAPRGAFQGGFLLAGKKVKAEVEGNAILLQRCEVKIKMHEVENRQGIRAWMESLARRVHPYLLKNACYLSLLIRNSLPVEICLEENVIFQLLTAKSFVKFKEGLPSSFRDLALESEYRSHDQTLPLQALPLHPILAQSMSKLCGKNIEEKLRAIVENVVTRQVMPLLEKNSEYEHQKIADNLKISFAAELKDFFSSQRLRLMSNNKGLKPLLYIREVKQKEQGWKWYSPKSVSPKDAYNIGVSFETQEVVKNYIAWQAIELMPMKKDLGIPSSNSMFLVVPMAREAERVMEQEVETEELLKLILLKCGKTLLFIRSIIDSSTCVYLYSRHAGQLNSGSLCIHKFKSRCSLLAFDELSRFLAIYDELTAGIKVYRFDETFTHCDWTGVELCLSEYNGSSKYIWMDLVPGMNEILLADDTKRVIKMELTQHKRINPNYIRLISPLQKACISPEGSCLITLRARSPNLASSVGSSDGTESVTDPSRTALSLEVYRLGDSPSLLKTMDLDFLFEEFADIEAKVAAFGAQVHLVLLSTKRPDLVFSKVLEITNDSKVCKLPEVQKESCPPLSYIFDIFDKYAVSPPLGSHKRSVNLKILLNVLPGKARGNRSGAICREIIECCVRKLKDEKGKDFSDLKLVTSASYVEDWQKSVDIPKAKSPMGIWIRKLICLVPLQIARAESNGLRPLSDGLEIPPHFGFRDSVSLSTAIRFGLYSTVFYSWNGCIKVISAMGKQSSGKSYLLNHLTGSLLDVAGGGCTDGVWMTLRPSEDCLYVVLDFEGLRSFERSNQEDVLLSVLNAAVSDITLFNNKGLHPDKDTEALFDRFHNAVNIVKEDGKLFKGFFYIAFKDVDISDVGNRDMEFFNQIYQSCCNPQDNFLIKMYGGHIGVAPMSPFHRPDFHEHVLSIASTVQELETRYNNGREFSDDLKLVIAQISARDWSPLDSKRVALKLHIMRKHLDSVIKTGCLNSDTNKALFAFHSLEAPDDPIQIEGYLFKIRDHGLELALGEEKQVLGSVFGSLKREYAEIVPRTGQNDEIWHSTFQNFLNTLAERRTKRVLKWVSSNTSEISNNGDVQKLILEIVAALAELKQGFSLCGSKCMKCFRRCNLQKGHPHDHSCMGDHCCMDACSYCTVKGKDRLPVETCSDRAGHGGPHDCRQISHTCGKTCHLATVSSRCNQYCSLIIGHAENHKCDSPQHMCFRKCSAPYCNDSCAISIESGWHYSHFCHQMLCTMKCCMKGCTRTCATKDHFHARDPDAKHFCEYEHPCHDSCEGPGICEALTQMVRQTRSFYVTRERFEYEHVSEQNGLRKECCLVIPPFKERHEGPHSHTTNPDAVHYCETKCKACGYFCHLLLGHPGLHNTVHGNMTKFVADDQEIDVMDRQYSWGEAGMAEMCMMHCKLHGRGHTHLTICPELENGVCTSKLYDGARHETRKYRPDIDKPKDEMTHEAYWRHLRFVDPCSKEEQDQFALCKHYCRHEEHQSSLASSISGWSGEDEKPYCLKKLWHLPISRTGHRTELSTGYISNDGHRFACNHPKNMPHHIVFVIDKSGFMSTTDIKPTLAKLQANHANRLGFVYEAISRFVRTRLVTVQDDALSVILFDCYAPCVIDHQDMDETVLDQLCADQNGAAGGGTYSAGIQLAESLIDRAMKLGMRERRPIIIFLSDRGNKGGMDPVYCVKRMKSRVPRLVLHTIMFGTDPDVEILKEMAIAGSGTFQLSLDELQLARSFERLAHHLKPTKAVFRH